MPNNKMHTLQESAMMPDMPVRMLPSFSVDERDLPEIKEWQVGNKYKLQMEVEMVSSSKNEYGTNEKMMARFKIHKIGENDMMSEKEKQGKMGHY